MTADGTEWKPKPKSEAEYNAYLDWLFKYAGNNLWSKLVRDFLVKDFGDSAKEQPKK